MPTFQQVIDEVRGGLSNERKAIEDAYANLDFYHGENEQYIEVREGEDAKSFDQRRKRTILLTYEVVEALCRHLYNPGPTRKLGNETANGWYQDQCEKADFNSLWQEADKLSTLNDWCAFQVVRDDDEERPIKIYLWGREELCVWTDEDDPTEPKIVCTIDRHDAQTRYRIWDEEQVCTLITKKWDGSRPTRTRERLSGDERAPVMVSPPEPHGYGVLPFAFVHFRPPVRRFDTPAIGTPLRKANQTIDAILCDLSESIQFYGRPVLIGRNLRADFRPTLRAGGWVRLEGDPTTTEYGAAPLEPSVEPLIVPVDIEGLWGDIEHQIDKVLESVGVPKSAVRMEQQATKSGVAIVAEQKPLLDRAKSRRPQFHRYEQELARLMCWVGYLQTEDPALEDAYLDPKLTLTWQEEEIDLPGPDRDAADKAALEMGITSRIDIMARRYGLTRQQAMQRLLQIQEDEAQFNALFPEGGPVMGPATPQPPIDQQGFDNGQVQDATQTQQDQGQAQDVPNGQG